MNVSISNSWRVTRVKFVSRVIAGGTPESSNSKYWDGSVPWLTPIDLGNENNDRITKTKRMLTDVGVRAAGLERLPLGSVVISTRAPIGSVGLLACEAVTNQGCKAIVPDPRKLDPRFTFYFALHSAETLQSFGLGTTFLELSTYALKNLRVSLPSPADQLRIASYLDEATGRIDRLVGLRRRQMELLWEQRTALIQETVTRGLNPSAPLKDSGIPWLGAIPEHWEVKRLKYFGFFKGGAGFPHEDQGNDVGEIPFIKVKALSDADAEGVLRIADDYVSHETAARLGAFVFPTNTVVFAKVGAALLLNRFRAIGQPTCIDNNMMGLVVDHRKAEWHFLLYVLSSLDFAQMVNPGPVPSLNEPQISNQKIGLPPLEEQREILAHIQRETAKLDALHLNYERQLALLAEYRAALIHECVTGQKVVD